MSAAGTLFDAFVGVVEAPTTAMVVTPSRRARCSASFMAVTVLPGTTLSCRARNIVADDERPAGGNPTYPRGAAVPARRGPRVPPLVNASGHSSLASDNLRKLPYRQGCRRPVRRDAGHPRPEVHRLTA